MRAHPTRRTCSGLAVLLAVSALATAALAHAAQDGITAELEMAQGEGQPSMSMTITVGDKLARMDMSSPEGEVSTVWSETGMLIIMHERQMYMEFTKEMMERMSQMMGGQGAQAQAEIEEFDPSAISFESTGETETINGYDTFEVLMHAEDGALSAVWMTESLEVGLFEVFARMSEPLSSMSMPFMGGGASPTDRLKEYEQYARANGLPDGRVVRLLTEDGSSITLGRVTVGPIDPAAGEPPAGYQKQTMPGMPRQ